MFDPDTLETDNPEPPKKFWVGFTVSFDRAWTFIRHLLGLHTLALCLLLGASPALAADIFCGHDDDENASYTACTGNDKDHDGYTTDGTGSHAELVAITDIDCDDTNWKISTNAWVDAGGGTVKRCKSDGTYTTATAVSALVASDIASTCATLKFLDDAGATTAGCGAYGAPCDPRCLVDSGRACYVAPSVTNDCFWWLPGTYTASATATVGGSAAQFYINNKDGSAIHPIINVADPTALVLLDSQGTSNATQQRLIYLDDSDYWKFYGFTLGSGWAGYGVYFNGGSSNEFAFGKVYDVDGGGSGHDNVSAIAVNGGSNNWVHQNLFKDNYERADPTYQNSVAGVTLFSGANNRVDFNSILSSSTLTAFGLKYKHGQASAPTEIIGNHIKDFTLVGIGWDTGGAIIKRNYVKATTSNNQAYCFKQDDHGGTPFYDSESKVWRNDCVNMSTLESFPRNSSGSLGNPYLSFKYNVSVDNSSAYSTSDSPVYRFAYYADNTLCSSMTGKFSVSSNGWYNSEAVAFKGGFAAGSTCATGANYASWAAWTGAGYDSGSYNETMTINSDGSVTGSNTSSFGVFGDSGATTTTSTSTTSTTTTSTTSTTSISAAANNVGGLAARYH